MTGGGPDLEHAFHVTAASSAAARLEDRGVEKTIGRNHSLVACQQMPGSKIETGTTQVRDPPAGLLDEQ